MVHQISVNLQINIGSGIDIKRSIQCRRKKYADRIDLKMTREYKLFIEA